MERVNKYEAKLFSVIDKIENKIESVSGKLDSFFLALIKYYELLFFLVLDLINQAGRLFRYTTFPLHWIYLKISFWLYNREDLDNNPLFEVGVHYIYGKPGSGKSTVTYHAMMDKARSTGKTSYTTAMMETPRRDFLGREYYYHQLFQPSEFFQDGQQVVRFNTERHNMIVYEEMLTLYHQRDNSKKSYNSEVLPMIAAMGTQRHQGIDQFYFISQLPRNDIALMQMLQRYHIPKIVKGFDYKHWLETGKFKFRIKGWRIKSHFVEPTSGNDYKLSKPKRWYYKCKHHEDMEYFNRLNMKKSFGKLRLHKGVKMQ